jgi:hypothetical protein
MLAIAPVDFQYHDTYFVVAHFHYVLVTGADLRHHGGGLLLAAQVDRPHVQRVLGKWHFWLSTIFVNVLVLPAALPGPGRHAAPYPGLLGAVRGIQHDEFVATVGGDAGFEFRPGTVRMQVHPGQAYTTHYVARNLRSVEASGQAVPSVSPGTAARYFQKTECFCFTRQDFTANELKDMPVLFIIDPEIPPEVTTVTLGYTFFDARG